MCLRRFLVQASFLSVGKQATEFEIYSVERVAAWTTCSCVMIVPVALRSFYITLVVVMSQQVGFAPLLLAHVAAGCATPAVADLHWHRRVVQCHS
jgi:hypothetical protein